MGHGNRNRHNKQKKQNKRKKGSSSSDEEQYLSKQPKQGGAAGVQVSDILSQTNSVLFEEDFPVFNTIMEHFEHSEQTETTEKKLDMPTPSNADLMKFLNRIEGKLSEVSEKLKVLDTLEKKVNEFDQDLKKLSASVEKDRKEYTKKLEVVGERLANLEFSGGENFDSLRKLEQENQKLKDNLCYLQSQSMRNNLVFCNIAEDSNERPEGTETKLRQFMIDKLKMAADVVEKLQLERVHRMGAPNPKYENRNIVCKFTFFKDREEVRKRSHNLKGTDYFIQEQFPSEVVEKRKKLMVKLREAKKSGQKAWLSYDTLYIDGKAVKG